MSLVNLTKEDIAAIAAIVKSAHDAKAARAESMPTDLDAVRVVCDGVNRLYELGWRDPSYAPKDAPLQLIEAGSSDIHMGYRDDIGFWIPADDDTWPSHPILWRPAPQEKP